MRFHSKHGPNVTLTEDGTVSEAREPDIVFSDQPLRPRESVKLEVLDGSPNFLYPLLYIGVTTKDPKHWILSVHPDDHQDTWCLRTLTGKIYIKGERAGSCEEWSRKGCNRDLQTGDKIELTMTRDRTVSISLNNTEVPDIFSCQLPDTNVWLVMMQFVKKIQIIPQALRPALSKLSSLTVFEGEDVNIETKILEGKPEPEIQWFLGSTPLSSSGRFTIGRVGDSCRLKMKRCLVLESGVVKVTATNQAGKCSQTASLTVKASMLPMVTGLNSQHIQESEDAIFFTMITGTPEPSVQWFLNKTKLSPSERISMKQEGLCHSLQIHECKMKDAGSVSVKATNVAGSKSAETNLKVKEKSVKPSIKNLVNVDIKEQDDAIFETIVHGKPTPKVTWYLNSKQLRPSERVIMVTEGQRYKLTLKQCQVDQSGYVRISAKNAEGKRTVEADLVIKEVVAKPILTTLKEIGIIEGETAHFVTIASGKPLPAVSWYKDLTFLEPSDSVQMSSNGTQHTLVMKNCSVVEKEIITAVATNKAGICSVKGSLTVKEKLEAPLLVRPNDADVIEGENAVFETKVSGIPKPMVTWYKDDQPLSPSNRVIIEELSDDIYRLTLIKCEMNQSGDIKVLATNKVDTAFEKVAFLIKEKLIEPTLTKLRGVTLYEAEDAIFETSSSGKPQPKIEWYKGQDILTNNKQAVIETTDKKHRLILKNCSLTEKEIISVVASNKAGSCTEMAELVVEEKPEKPTLTALRDTKISELETAVFETCVTGKPTPSVTWFSNSQQLNESEDVKMQDVEGNRHRLTLANCQTDQSGIIEVTAKNKAGFASTKAKLDVKDLHVFDVAKEFVQNLGLHEFYFDPTYDVCFCEVCHSGRGDKLSYYRGNPPKEYGLPIGWCKFGLRTKPQAMTKGIFENWHVVFHGTRAENIGKILDNGDLLLPGDVTPSGEQLAIPKNHWDPNHPDPKMRSPEGHDVNMFYFSPSIRYAGCRVYAPYQSWVNPKTGKQHSVKVAFQVRIQPGTYKIGPQTIGAARALDPLFKNSELEWFTKRRGVSILVGLLVKVEGPATQLDVDVETMKLIVESENQSSKMQGTAEAAGIFE